MKKTLISILSAIALTSLFSSCGKYEIEGNHQVTTEHRQIEDFNQIESNGEYKIYFTQSSVRSLQVCAEENLLPYIYTKVEGNRLIIENREDRNIDNHDPLLIYVSGPYLDDINLNGSGVFNCDSLYAKNLNLDLNGSGKINMTLFSNFLQAHIHGSGEIDLSGTCDESEMKISGSGDIYSYDLIQDTCFCTISGSGNIFATVNKLLDVKITGSGSVYYKGNPVVNSSITGSGRITHN